jgi:hypothetical protein
MRRVRNGERQLARLSAGISTADALEARLRSIRDVPGDEDRFLADVRALARDLDVRLGCDSLLQLALAGLTRVGARARLEPGPGAVFPGRTVLDAPMSRDEIIRVAGELSQDSPAWAARLRGLRDVPAPAGEDLIERPWVMSGRALRWLVDRGVPMGAQRMGRIDEYVKSVIEMLDRGDDTEPLGAHLNVVVGQAEGGVHLPLAEELAALAWLCSVHDEYVDIDGLLHVRDMGLRGMYG